MKPVRSGTLSTARIGRMKTVPTMMKRPLCEIVAVASRDERADRKMAAELGIPRTDGSYDDLLAALDSAGLQDGRGGWD